MCPGIKDRIIPKGKLFSPASIVVSKSPIEEMEVARSFFPPLVVCKDCWELLK